MGYVPEIPADRKFHGKYHDAVVKGNAKAKGGWIWNRAVLRQEAIADDGCFISCDAECFGQATIKDTAHISEFAKVFDKYPDHRFIGLDEYVGYQHADIQTAPSAGNDLKFAVTYDPHYCRALIARPSDWNLHLSDWLLAKIKSSAIWVDGKKTGVVHQELTPIPFAAGLQTHTVEVRQ